MAIYLWFFANMKYLVYMVIALFVPLMIAGRAGRTGLARRYGAAVVAAILGGWFSGFASTFPDFQTGIGETPTGVGSGLAMNDAFTAFVLAAAFATLFYRLGTLLSGAAADAGSS